MPWTRAIVETQCHAAIASAEIWLELLLSRGSHIAQMKCVFWLRNHEHFIIHLYMKYSINTALAKIHKTLLYSGFRVKCSRSVVKKKLLLIRNSQRSEVAIHS